LERTDESTVRIAAMKTRIPPILAAGLLVLLLNSAYLAVRDDASLLYVGNVVLHLFLGAVIHLL